jgi:hypothetical protein
MWLEKEDLWRAVRKESSCIMFVHQWMEVSEIFMMYIGKVKSAHLGKQRTFGGNMGTKVQSPI